MEQPPGTEMPGLDLAFHFDTKGYSPVGSAIIQVRLDIAELAQQLLADSPETRVAAMAHGSGLRCDVKNPVTRDFAVAPAAEVVTWLSSVPVSLGQTSTQSPSFQQVLRQALTGLSWRPGSRRALVLICDALPSSTDSWLGAPETGRRLLRQLGASVYCVQCFHSTNANQFIQILADSNGFLRQPLAQYGGVRQFLRAMPLCCGSSGAPQSVLSAQGDTKRTPFVLDTVPQVEFNAFANSVVAVPASSVTMAPANAAAFVVARRRTAAPVSGATSRKTKTQQTKTAGGRGGNTRPAKNHRTSLTWAPWRLIARPGGGHGLSRSSWQRFGTGSARRSLQVSTAGQVAVELAVQSHPGARRLPVFGSVLRVGGDRRRSSVTFGHLLAGVRPSVRAQLLRVLHQGMRVHARVAGVDTAAASADELMKPQNYAWNSGRSVRCSGVFVSVSEKSLRKFTDGDCKH